mmetsp:Transcript_64256/g.178491  ORF Transcript_64256/g.178491 Transcript_64256/m.178491 type:complete len:427 (-) Transcript_64256:5184-6464(-)
MARTASRPSTMEDQCFRGTNSSAATRCSCTFGRSRTNPSFLDGGSRRRSGTSCAGPTIHPARGNCRRLPDGECRTMDQLTQASAWNRNSQAPSMWWQRMLKTVPRIRTQTPTTAAMEARKIRALQPVSRTTGMLRMLGAATMGIARKAATVPTARVPTRIGPEAALVSQSAARAREGRLTSVPSLDKRVAKRHGSGRFRSPSGRGQGPGEVMPGRKEPRRKTGKKRKRKGRRKKGRKRKIGRKKRSKKRIGKRRKRPESRASSAARKRSPRQSRAGTETLAGVPRRRGKARTKKVRTRKRKRTGIAADSVMPTKKNESSRRQRWAVTSRARHRSPTCSGRSVRIGPRKHATSRRALQASRKNTTASRNGRVKRNTSPSGQLKRRTRRSPKRSQKKGRRRPNGRSSKKATRKATKANRRNGMERRHR